MWVVTNGAIPLFFPSKETKIYEWNPLKPLPVSVRMSKYMTNDFIYLYIANEQSIMSIKSPDMETSLNLKPE